MIKIIETRIIRDCKNTICDHQSRVIECLSWREYKKQFQYYGYIKPKYFMSSLGCGHGYCMPRECKISKLEIDEFHLICEYKRSNIGGNEVLMAYYLKEN